MKNPFAFGLLALLLSGCGSTTSVMRVDYADIAGRPCELLKAKTDWYSAEASTTCIDGDGKPVMIATQHTDLSMLTAAGAVIAAIITVAAQGI